ncbi:MAG: SLBB domain-containing protein [Eubacterium ramulus]
MRQLLVVCSVILLLGTFSERPDRSAEDILLGTEESVTEEVSGEIPVLKSESENVKQEESEENASSEIKDSEYPEADDTGKTVFVYVCGAVCQPGVYELSAQSRAYEAVAMAGGLLENARSDAVNLAEVLTDGQKLHIPYIGEDAVAEASGQTTTTDSKGSDRRKPLISIRRPLTC